MKSCFWFRHIFLIVLVFLLTANTKVFAQEAPAEWTLMFYMDSDNDLEAPQMNDLEEMMAVGSSANINIVVLADRSDQSDPGPASEHSNYTNRPVGGLKDWTTAKLLVVEKGKLRQLADWGEVNMGDPATLKKFIQTVAGQFPAKRFGLVFGDHGSGWVGIVHDESAEKDTLTSAELPPVFKEISAATGKFELIGFDACLMANFEAVKAVAPFGKTMVASEELEPGFGWSYTPIMTALSKTPTMDGVTLGKTIVDTYRDFYLGKNLRNRKEHVTLSVIDLAKIPALETAVSNLGIRNQTFMKSNGRNTWLKTADALSETEEYGDSGEGEEAAGQQMFDLIHYSQNIKLKKPDAETVKAADAVMAAVKAAVIYKINGPARPGSSGLSIYFPPDQEKVNRDYETTPFSLTGKWKPFVWDFLEIENQDQQAPVVENIATTDEEIDNDDVAVVTAQSKADDIAEATFVLAESNADEQIIIGAIPTEPGEAGELEEEWDGEWFSISDGKKELICPITDFTEIEDEKDVYYVEVPAQVRDGGAKEWRDVTLYFMLDFNEEEVVGEFVSAYSFEGNRAREVEILEGDSVRPVYLVVDKNGDTSDLASDDANDILNVTQDNGIIVGRTDVAAGNYLVGFMLTDFSGNTSEKFTPVTIE